MSKLKLGIICTMAMGALVAACGPSGERPDESGEIMIIQIDEQGGMRFEPENIILTAGQTVRIVLENRGEKDHEFMIGQNVIRMEDGAPNGFEIDFFDGIEDQVTVMLGEGAMLMIDNEMIMADDMGYECVGVNGCTSYQTPHLDRLAKQGMRFTHCYSQPLCTPTRVRWAIRSGVLSKFVWKDCHLDSAPMPSGIASSTDAWRRR